MLSRAVALSPESSTSFEARALLDELAKPIPVDKMSADELKQVYVGTWSINGNQTARRDQFTIYLDEKGVLQIKGTTSCFLGCSHYRNLSVDGVTVHFTIENLEMFNLRLVSANRLEGSYSASLMNGQMFAIKQ